MSVATMGQSGQRNTWSALIFWAPILLGLAVLYVPTYVSLANGIWQTEEQGHGPLILAVVLWLVWSSRHMLVRSEPKPKRGLAFLSLILGLLMYILGRSQDILVFEVGSQLFVVMGVLLLMVGVSGLRALWFPVFFIVFMIPLPSMVVDALTSPLKQSVSVVAESVLYAAGYPIARSGVTLTIGPYQLLVADACSGLHSLYSLGALGCLYLFLMRHGAIWRNTIIGLSIFPIAIGANIVRVIVLVLVTYHLGDEAGQGFLHGFAGMVLFIAALLLLFAIDALLGLFSWARTEKSHN